MTDDEIDARQIEENDSWISGDLLVVAYAYFCCEIVIIVKRCNEEQSLKNSARKDNQKR